MKCVSQMIFEVGSTSQSSKPTRASTADRRKKNSILDVWADFAVTTLPFARKCTLPLLALRNHRDELQQLDRNNDLHRDACPTARLVLKLCITAS